MGGTGSGRWTYYEKQRTVEECWAMSISEVERVLDFSKPGSISHLLRPTIPKTGKRMSPVRIKSKIGDDGKPLLGLSYTVKDRQGLEHRVEEVVRLQTTRPNFGGVRWWFSCPVCSTVRSAVAGLASSTAHRGADTSPAAAAST